MEPQRPSLEAQASEQQVQGQRSAMSMNAMNAVHSSKVRFSERSDTEEDLEDAELATRLAKAIRPVLGRQLCHEVRIAIAEESAKWQEQMMAMRKEMHQFYFIANRLALTASCSTGLSAPHMSSSPSVASSTSNRVFARQEKSQTQHVGHHKDGGSGKREHDSFISDVSADHVSPSSSEDEGAQSMGTREGTALLSSHNLVNPATADCCQVATCPELQEMNVLESEHGETVPSRIDTPMGKVATCPELIALDERSLAQVASGKSVRDEESCCSGYSEEPKEPPRGRKSSAHLKEANRDTISNESTRLGTIQSSSAREDEALMYLPSEKEKEKPPVNLKLKHPAQVDTQGELLDLLLLTSAIGDDKPRGVGKGSQALQRRGGDTAAAASSGAVAASKGAAAAREEAAPPEPSPEHRSQSSSDRPQKRCSQLNKGPSLFLPSLNDERTTHGGKQAAVDVHPGSTGINRERACMIGVKSQSKKKKKDCWTHEREAPVRGLANLERSLALELFETKELVRKEEQSNGRTGDGGKRSGKRNTETESFRIARWPLPSERPALKYFRRSKDKDKVDINGTFSELKPGAGKASGQEQRRETESTREGTPPLNDKGDKCAKEPVDELLGQKSCYQSVSLQPPTSSSIESLTTQVTSWGSPSCRTVPSADSVRRQQEKRITKELTEAVVPPEGEHQPFFRKTARDKAARIVIALPKLCGVVPWMMHKWRWPCMIYQHGVVLLAAGSAVVLGRHAYDEFTDSEETALSPCVDLIISGGASLGILACVFRGQRQAAIEAVKLITSAAKHNGFFYQWQRESAGDHCCNLGLWVAAVTVRYFIRPDANCALFAFSSFVLTGMVSTVIYSCRCLARMIDHFCCEIVDAPNYVEAMQEWNVLQAVCRTLCGTLQFCFLAMQATGTALAMLAVAEIHRGYRGFAEMIPGLLMTLMMIRIALWAAAVTDKCARVPMLVNCVSAEVPNLHWDRMYVVEYIVQSQAGFYLFEVRVTSSTVLKTLYCVGAAAFGLASQLL